jgi:hypothetical protein
LSSRRRLILLLTLALLFGLGCLRLLWQWKVPEMVERRLERITGHRATIASVAFTHRLELVAYDVRIAGAPPFESQTLAHADRAVVQLGGPGGFWTPSEVDIDGLDLEYLGTPAGDNVRGLAEPAKAGGAGVSRGGAVRGPRVRVHNARLRGSVALPYGVHVAFRVPSFQFQREGAGPLSAVLANAVLDVEGLGSLRAPFLSVRHDVGGLRVESQGNVALDVAGGGTLFDGLALTATLRGAEATFGLHGSDADRQRVAFSGRWNAKDVDLVADVQNASLRPLGAPAARRGLGFDRAQASCHASLSLDRSSLRADFSVDVKVDGVDFLHPSVDVSPWRAQRGSLALRGEADLASGRVDLTSGAAKMLGVPFAIDGWFQVSRAPRGFLVLATPRRAPLPCASLLLGQPDPVKKVLAGLRVDGRIGFRLSVEFDANAWEDLKLDASIDPVCTAKSEPAVLANLLPMLQHPGTPMRVPSRLPLGPFHPDFVSIGAMPKHLLGAFLTSEDGKFFRHRGFDLEMIRHALAQDLQNRSFQRGASTITQQLAKNLFLSQRRTLARKLEEAVLTWRLQQLLSKERVLELYLNVIELGPRIRGVKQAAREYFGKEVMALTPLESAHLAALTPNPHALARRFRDGQIDEGWQQRLFDLLGMMRRLGRLSAADLATARATKLVLRELGPR